MLMIYVGMVIGIVTVVYIERIRRSNGIYVTVDEDNVN